MDFRIEIDGKAMLKGLIAIWAVCKICKAVRNARKETHVVVVGIDKEPKTSKKQKVESK